MIRETVRDAATYAHAWRTTLRHLGFDVFANRPRVRDFVGTLRAWERQRALDAWLPPKPLESLIPCVRGLDLKLVNSWPVYGNVNATELVAMCLIARAIAADRVLEIGTFDGNTAINLALNLPDHGRVHTLDLPPETQEARTSTEADWAWKRHTGTRRREVPPDLALKLDFLVGDSQVFDFSPYFGRMDLVFVDGSHELAQVRVDSTTARRCVRPGGVVLWHDAAPSKTGVIGALKAFDGAGLCRIQGTTLAFWLAPS